MARDLFFLSRKSCFASLKAQSYQQSATTKEDIKRKSNLHVEPKNLSETALDC
jgi:hypothetical protein